MTGSPSDFATAGTGSAVLAASAAELHARLIRQFVIGGLILAVPFTWLFWDFLYRQVRFAVQQQADWGHTLIIPLIAGYLVYVQRDKLLAKPFHTTWVGLLPVFLGVGLYVLFTLGPQAWQHHNLRGAAVGLAIIGLTLLFFGWRAMRYLLFPLIFLIVFSQTISNRFMQMVTYPLQDLAAWGAHKVLIIFGVDVSLDGNVLNVLHAGKEIPLNVAEACSGMRMVMAFFALGTAMAFLGLKYNWQRIALVMLGLPTALAVNVLRVVTLAVLAMFNTGFAAGEFHSLIGLVWLVPAFMIYLGLMIVLRKMVIEEDEMPNKPSRPRRQPAPQPIAAARLNAESAPASASTSTSTSTVSTRES
jgi:exosortase